MTNNYLAKGFTLVELVMVMAIIGILTTAAIVFIDPLNEIRKGEDSQRKTDLAKIQAGLELFYGENNSYPDEGGFPDQLTNSDVKFIDHIPVDPKTKADYVYVASPAGCAPSSAAPCTSYELSACLENDKDKDSDANNGLANKQECAAKYSYTVYSP